MSSSPGSSVLMYARRSSNGQRNPWAKTRWNFWRSDFAADSGPMSSLRDQMTSPRLLQSSNRRVCDQADRKASLLPVSSRNRKAQGILKIDSPFGLKVIDVYPDDLAESRVAYRSRRDAKPIAHLVGGIDASRRTSGKA